MSLEDGPAQAAAALGPADPGADPAAASGGAPGVDPSGAPGAAPAKAKRKHSRWLMALEILTVLAVVAPFIAYEIATNLGGSSTAGSSQVTVSNDGATTVTLQSCAPGCSAPAQVVLTAGASTQLSVAKAGTTYYLVDRSGALAGCLPLAPSERLPVATSRAGACPGPAHR